MQLIQHQQSTEIKPTPFTNPESLDTQIKATTTGELAVPSFDSTTFNEAVVKTSGEFSVSSFDSADLTTDVAVAEATSFFEDSIMETLQAQSLLPEGDVKREHRFLHCWDYRL